MMKSSNGLPIQAVLFDFDGTLTQPETIDFPAIRAALGCPPDRPVLEYIQEMQSPDLRRAAMTYLVRIEDLAAARSRANGGAEEMVRWLKRTQMPVGIITRNSRASVLRAIANFTEIRTSDFDLIITRDDPLPPKPSGAGVVWAACQWGLTTGAMLVVGDFVFDCQSGRAAGARTALLDPGGDPRLAGVACDYRIRHLLELKKILQSTAPV